MSELARVRHVEGLWVVEVLSAAVGRWIVQGEHLTEAAAQADLRNWQPPRVQITPDRLFIHWGIHLTTGYPIQAGTDGLYVVCTDASEAEYLRDHIAPGAELHPFGGTWDARALALADLPT